MSAPAVTPHEPALAELDAFEAARIDPEAFDHEAHVRVAWTLLEATDLVDAIARYAAALRRITRKFGAEGKYHETITWFFMLLIAERRREAPGVGWDAFRQRNDDLVADAGTLLSSYYSPARLASPLARSQFLLPDRAPGAQGAATTR